MKTYEIPGEGVFEEMLEQARDDMVEIQTDEPLVCADFLQRFIRACDNGNERVTCNITKAGGRIYMFARLRGVSDGNGRMRCLKATEGIDAG
jgi:hypothetical protein